jgi:hypothetical protein
MANTANYNQLLPTVGASASSWGSENNALHVKWDAELWKALYLDGSRAMTGALAAAVGSAAAPGLSFAGDANSGFYWAGADSVAISLGGTARVTFSTTGATFTGGVSCTTLAPSGLTSIAASAAGGAKLNIAPGAAPTTPANGDVWTTSTGMFARLNGATVDLTSTAGPWATPRDLSLTGEVTATLSNVDGSANRSAAATIANNAVTTAKINDGAVTTAKLADAAVSFAKLVNATGSARFVGRKATAGSGVMQEMTAGEALAALGLTNMLASAWVECALSAGPSFAQTGLNLSLSADTGTGNYIASFGAPLASANYAVVVSGTRTAGGGDVAVCSYHSRTTGGFKVRVETVGGAGLAPTNLSIIVFGPFA